MPSWSDDLQGFTSWLTQVRNQPLQAPPSYQSPDATLNPLDELSNIWHSLFGGGGSTAQAANLPSGGDTSGTGDVPATGGAQPGQIPNISGQQALENLGVPNWQIPGLLAAANAYKVPVEILAGLEKYESSFNMEAVGGSGEHGPFQFMPGTAEGFGLDWSRMQDPTYFAQEAAAAAQYLAGNFATWGNWTDALYAYNGGDSAVGVANSRKQNPQYATTILKYATDARNGMPVQNSPSPHDLPGGSTVGQQPYVTSDGVQIAPNTPEAQAFSLAESVWKTVYGTDAPYYVVQAFLDAGVKTVEQANSVLQTMPSPIGGMNLGDYTALKKSADSISNKYTGRPVPESFLAQMAKENRTNPALIDAWFWNHGFNEMPKDAYQQIFDAATTYTKTWNTVPDPAAVQHVYNTVQQQGGYPYVTETQPAGNVTDGVTGITKDPSAATVPATGDTSMVSPQ